MSKKYKVRAIVISGLCAVRISKGISNFNKISLLKNYMKKGQMLILMSLNQQVEKHNVPNYSKNTHIVQFLRDFCVQYI